MCCKICDYCKQPKRQKINLQSLRLVIGMEKKRMNVSKVQLTRGLHLRTEIF